MKMIRVENVSKEYPVIKGMKNIYKIVSCKKIENRVKVLDNINFTLERGDVLGIIGDNGAGKTTLLRIIAGLSYPSTGKVVVDGKVSAILDLAFGLNLNLSGRENIWRILELQDVPRREIARIEGEIITFSELEKVILNPVRTYSLGMRARLLFSIATARVNDFFLVDELLSVGDEHFRWKSFSRIRNMVSSRKAAVIVSHNLSFIERLCNKVLWLDKGKVVMMGEPHETLMRYYGRHAAQENMKYPREYAYIEYIKVEIQKENIIIRSTINRTKSVPFLHYKIAIHDNHLGVLTHLINTAWRDIYIPSGRGPVEVTIKTILPQGLKSGLVAGVLYRDEIIEDAWGWDNCKQVYFVNPTYNNGERYVNLNPKCQVRILN